jgi:hypothetical protein
VIETSYRLLLWHRQNIDVFVVVGRSRNQKTIHYEGLASRGKTFFEESFVKVLHESSEGIRHWSSELPDVMFKQQIFVCQKL